MADPSVQVQHFVEDGVWAFLDLARPQWIKWLDFTDSGIAGLRAYKALVPGCKVVGRVVGKNGWSWDKHYQETLPLHFLLGNLVDYWELPNEPAKDVAGVRTLNTWTLAAMAGAPMSFRGVIGNFAEGNPSQLVMEWTTDWPLIYRSSHDFVQLFLEAGFATSDLRCELEAPQGTVLMATARVGQDGRP